MESALAAKTGFMAQLCHSWIPAAGTVVSTGLATGPDFTQTTHPINIVTLTAELDKSKNSVQSVKLVFGPPPKKDEKAAGNLTPRG
jgi:hypothetical protein